MPRWSVFLLLGLCVVVSGYLAAVLIPRDGGRDGTSQTVTFTATLPSETAPDARAVQAAFRDVGIRLGALDFRPLQNHPLDYQFFQEDVSDARKASFGVEVFKRHADATLRERLLAEAVVAGAWRQCLRTGLVLSAVRRDRTASFAERVRHAMVDLAGRPERVADCTQT